MSAPRLSARAKLLLALFRERSGLNGNAAASKGEIFLPKLYRAYRCELFDCDVMIGGGGGGDARAMSTLARRGLIELCPGIGKYAARCTEDGALVYENQLRAEVAS